MSESLSHLKMSDGYKLRFDGLYNCETFTQVKSLMLDGVPPNRIVYDGAESSKFNSMVSTENGFSKDVKFKLDHSWKIPDEYKELDIYGIIAEKLESYLVYIPEAKHDIYFDRVSFELRYFEDVDAIEFIQAIIFVIDTFTKNNIFWGVGRGSSCASLCFFLIGLHKVDPIKYDIPTTDFFK